MVRTPQGGKELLRGYPLLLALAKKKKKIAYAFHSTAWALPLTASSIACSPFYFVLFCFVCFLFFVFFFNETGKYSFLAKRFHLCLLNSVLHFNVIFIFQNIVYFITGLLNFFYWNNSMSIGYTFESVEDLG